MKSFHQDSFILQTPNGEPIVNPLLARLGKGFFSQVPKAPGVYWMKGQGDEVLYIGKAKNLKNRLLSYQRAQPHQVSRKVIRLIHLIHSIEWEVCESEQKALLKENFLLRTYQPPFNLQNTYPETYYFIGMKWNSGKKQTIEFALTCNPELETEEGIPLFGVYKGKRLVREGYSALLRLLWAAEEKEWDDRLIYPSALVKHHPAYRYTLPFAMDVEKSLKSLLEGRSKRILRTLTETLLANEKMPRFIHHCIQNDLNTLIEFYQKVARKNDQVNRHFKRDQKLILQNEIDDLLTSLQFYKKERSKKKIDWRTASEPFKAT